MTSHTARIGRVGALVITLVAALGSIAPASAAGSVSTADRAAAVARAVSWLKTQQQPDGGFEVAQFPGFETRDAALAIAEAAQTGTTWSASVGLAAVEATRRDGHSPLDSLRTFAASGIDAGGAAKLVVLTTAPLGLSSGDFGGVDLGAIVAAGRQPDGSYGVFSNTLWAALAQHLLTGSIAPDTIAVIRAAQQANGGWGFAGDPTAGDLDPDTTGLAIQALAAAGPAGADAGIDAAIARALAFLDAQHDADGSWKSPFDSGNPNSTALATLGIAAAGHDPTGPCFHTVGVYTDPAAYLLGTQTFDGRFTSPNDGSGINTFATSQSVEALLASWLPVGRRADATCETATTTTTTVPVGVAAEQAEAAIDAAPEDGSTASGELPRTGTDGSFAIIGAGLLAIGAVTVLVTRRA